MSEYISYKGEVRITSRYKGSLIREQIVHNEGKPYLFQYLCQCLVAIQGITGNNPNQITVIGGASQSQSRSATARYSVDGKDHYTEFSATFTQNDFDAGGYSDSKTEGGKGYVKLELKRDANLFAETYVENFTNMSKGEAVTIVWRMTFTDASSSAETSNQSVASPIAVQTVSAPKKRVKQLVRKQR